VWQKMEDGHEKLSAACSAALCWRVLETLLMLLVPAIATSRKLISSQFLFSDSLALAMMVACSWGLYRLILESKTGI